MYMYTYMCAAYKYNAAYNCSKAMDSGCWPCMHKQAKVSKSGRGWVQAGPTKKLCEYKCECSERTCNMQRIPIAPFCYESAECIQFAGIVVRVIESCKDDLSAHGPQTTQYPWMKEKP